MITAKAFDPTAGHFQDMEKIPSDEDKEVILIGATGSRLDHTIANISLLSEFAIRNIQASIVDQHNTITMIKGPSSHECIY